MLFAVCSCNKWKRIKMENTKQSSFEYKQNTSSNKKRVQKNFKGYFFITLILLFFVFLFLLIQMVKVSNETRNHQAAIRTIGLLEQENTIFRAVTPIKSSVPEIIKQAEVNKLLVPGWVTRVYNTGMKDSELSAALDLGSFIMNEMRFTLSTHKNYGIDNPDKALYQMNGLYASNIAGNHQVAVNSQIALRNINDIKKAYTAAECHISVKINHKTILDKYIRLSSDLTHKQVVTGQIELEKGVFPISSKFYCDKIKGINNHGPLFSINFRSPDEFSFKNQGLSVFHIYDINES